jgi:hypothetical protein
MLYLFPAENQTPNLSLQVHAVLNRRRWGLIPSFPSSVPDVQVDEMGADNVTVSLFQFLFDISSIGFVVDGC